MRSPRTPTPKSTTIIWHEAELRSFINHMVENVRKGLKTNSTFTKVGWDNITKGLEAKFKRPFVKQQLRNEMNKLRKKYNSFRALLETTGFGWDANAQTATTNDSVWESAIQMSSTDTAMARCDYCNHLWDKFTTKMGLIEEDRTSNAQDIMNILCG
ncbi:uncharacterized protein LOC122080315 [Macadamia integrifolia]|uniref:uncharacterized protein LOC122080315 n=1 Tax=Macadamia integrifolia TaxID=60698 RepID=UPI001C501CE9|nr:uncharacterized protein LOC122080315 [Macadamia integrifolia]